MPAEVIDSQFYRLVTKDKTYKLKCQDSQSWVTAIN